MVEYNHVLFVNHVIDRFLKIYNMYLHYEPQSVLHCTMYSSYVCSKSKLFSKILFGIKILIRLSRINTRIKRFK